MKAMRYAHCDGHTDVCYDDSGRYILTCGMDGDVRIWEGIDDDDAKSHRVGDRAYAIAFRNGRFFTATDNNAVQASKFPDGMPDGLITRFTAPVTHMVFNASGSTMVAGASDFTVKVVDVASSSHGVYHGHKAPLLSVALDPKEQFVATSSCDGTVQIWQVNSLMEVKTLNLLPKCSDSDYPQNTLSEMAPWFFQFLLVPVEKEIHMYSRNTWEMVDKLSHSDITGTVNVLAVRPHDQHVAVGCVNGGLFIFDWKLRKLVEKHRHQKKLSITALVWNPQKSQQIAFCDNEVSQVMGAGSAMDGIFDDDDDDDDMFIQASSTDVDHNAEDNVGNDDDNDGAADDDDDAASIDLGIIKKQLMPLIMNEDSNATGLREEKTEGASFPSHSMLPMFEGFKPTPLQKPFQPGSSPEHLSSRYMKWNNVGIIRQYNTEEENSIDIEFHDTAIHHAMHITNNCDYSMADLSIEAVILATASDDDSNSKLLCMHFGSWDSSKEWSATMPEGESIQAVALGEGWLAVATSLRNVRLFTIGGIQRHMLTLPGPVVCLVAHGSRLLMVYHAGMGIVGEQNLAYRIVDTSSQKNTLISDHLPLSPSATLSWIGFSMEGTPFYMDSQGVVRMMNTALGYTWSQVADTKDHAKGKSDHYWIVGVNENPQQLRCIPCKGSRYPATLPRPAVAVLPFQLPLCEMSSEKSQYEEIYLRNMLFTQHLLQLAHEGIKLDDITNNELRRPAQESLMKLFALSAKSEREFRAVEVCKLMPEEHTLQLSIKYATRLGHLQLAQRLSQLARERVQQAQTLKVVEEEEVEDFRTALLASHNTIETEWSINHRTDNSEQEEEKREEEEEEEDEEDRTHFSGPVLTLKPKETFSKKTIFGKANPFKVASQEKDCGKPAVKGSHIFDNMKKVKERTPVISPLPITVKQTKSGHRKVTIKTPQQGKITQQTKIAFSTNSESLLLTKQSSLQQEENEQTSENEPMKKPTAFDLWLTESRDNLQESQSDLSAEEFSRMAVDTFRALSKEDRQVWIQKAKDQTQLNTSLDKKRKRDKDEDDKEENIPEKKTANVEPKKPLSQSANTKLSNFTFSPKS
ncbi:hypothetical protein C0Q70_13090 [Pomacea canaliculata]|uniref:HMG box domain-containing protein n=1 Tax=Pomacea canaliculata TaxID=400727 RepID=A0A2T7NWA1_POMCA|nr:hypothetical protein C0Q70_13090 [Pomacea canaliculata]